MIRKDICTRTLADGSLLSIPVFHFPGTDATAKKVYIQSGIHGSEVQGYLVALHLIDTLLKNPPKGDVTIVPIANPYALNIKAGEYTLGCFDPVTGENWNRNYIDLSFLATEVLQENLSMPFDDICSLFKERMLKYLQKKLDKESSAYSKIIALQLQHIALKADIVLDLHCDTISVAHLYSPSYAMDSAVNLHIPFIIEIPHIFAGALDEAAFCPWVQLTQQYNEQNKTDYTPPMEAFTIELGSQETLDEESSVQQAQSIFHYLYTKDIIKEYDANFSCTEKIYSCNLENFKTVYAKCGGMITRYGSLGVMLQPQEMLYTLHNVADLRSCEFITTAFLGNLTQYEYPEEKSIILTHSASPIVHEGMALMKVMTNFQLYNCSMPVKKVFKNVGK